ncbi:right-handed parallel beta-helix repeat-containing protein [Chryseobacterium sp. RU33C]|uniref:right-handed parallel beta-helix repeat-containing protein n=1 Tax=Chryseobacterium sp. RU33C TaxID=1907398 RepID=UPI000954FA25|nr:right-handed parallel beta-helix repeat-containing protein [Chryseobacterium sp. RU33C]SIR12489.1 hypothetical protein SAMN05880573_11670 [Chryseobacterium sp. RU33C]
MRTISVFFLFNFLLFSSICCSQKRKEILIDYSSIITQDINIQTADFFKIETVLPKGYVKDGSVDYTNYIQKAIDANKNVIMPDFPLMTTGIFAQSNSQIYFQKNSALILKPTADVRYQIIGLHAIENVKIYNPRLIGDRDKHLDSKGEWGMGIDIRGARNIEIYNINISNCWGDGIMIVKTMNSMRSGIARAKLFEVEKIKIIGGVINNVRRNGISIEGGKDLIIKDLLIANINGTNPMAAIDIEPNDNINILENINLSNIKINNVNVGIDLHLGNYGSQVAPKSTTIFCSNISVENANGGIYIAGFKAKPDIRKIGGYFKVDKLSTKNVVKPFSNGKLFDLYPQIQKKD